MGLLEVIGIAAILPFMELLSKPDAISQSSFLTKFYDFFAFNSDRNFLIATGLFVIGILTVSNLFAIGTTYLQQKISWSIAHKKGLQLLRTYEQKPYSYFLSQNTSQLRSYLINEVSALTSGILIPIIEFVSRTIICLTIFSLLLIVSLQVTLTMLAILGTAYLIIFISRQKLLKKLGTQRVDANVDRYKFLEEMLSGIKTVKIYGVQDYFFSRYEKASKQFIDIHPKVKMVYATPKYLLELLAFGGILSITMYLFITTGDLSKILPRLSFYAVAGYRLLPALQSAFSSAAKIKHSMPSLNKLYDDLILGVDKKEKNYDEIKKLSFNTEITVENLCFKYENTDINVINDFRFRIEKGNTVAFVGSTGSGKTTLVDIITGLLNPTEGSLKVDQTTINPDNVMAWQKNIAYVPQEVFLYDETVKANIAIGVNENKVNDIQLIEAMKMADIYDFVVNELPMGLETKIGERGVRLSGGQRQRLGLARALYTNPSLLVLDEATSALDGITEKGIMESMRNLPEDLTIIMIAHRISTVKDADTIFLLEKGDIVNQGSYQDLIKNNSTFRAMADLS